MKYLRFSILFVLFGMVCGGLKDRKIFIFLLIFIDMYGKIDFLLLPGIYKSIKNNYNDFISTVYILYTGKKSFLHFHYLFILNYFS